MKTIASYFFMTLIILQGLFLFFYFTGMNFLGLLSWIGTGNDFSLMKLLSPLVVYGAIKICFWFADPLSKLFTIILRWVVLVAIVYFVYWLFFV